MAYVQVRNFSTAAEMTAFYQSTRNAFFAVPPPPPPPVATAPIPPEPEPKPSPPPPAPMFSPAAEVMIERMVARQGRGPLVVSRNGEPTVHEIRRVVAQVFDVTVAELISMRRKIGIVIPRQIAAAIAWHLTTGSLPHIGRHLGGRDHTTILYACRKMAPLIQHVQGIIGDGATVLEWAQAMKRELRNVKLLSRT